MPKKIVAIALAVLLLLAIPLNIGASPITSVPYNTYDYNFYEESIAAPAGYVPAERIDGAALGLDGSLAQPQDIFYDGKETVYLLDSGNARVLLLDTQFKVKDIFPLTAPATIDMSLFPGLTEEDVKDIVGTEPVEVKTATGITVGTDGRMYVADPTGECVHVYNADRTYAYKVTRPETARLDEEMPFNAAKVSVDNRNNLYVVAQSGNMGTFVFDGEGNYQRLFGGNSVVQTAEVIMKYMLRPFLTQAQLEGMQSSVPITIANFDVDAEGFMYTTTIVSEESVVPSGVVRKLNYLGQDILEEELVFGDLEWDRQSPKVAVITSFNDVDIDSGGFINLLDKARGRVFQYAETGELIAVFGAYGDQFGEFGTDPQAIETIGDSVVVVDTSKNCLIRFEPTSYAKQYRAALLRLKRDDFDGSLETWQSLLAENSNNANAYYGIGRVYDMQGDYKSAMEYFKLAGDRDAYSEAFQEYRNLTIKALFVPIVGVVAGLLVIYAIYRVIKKKRGKVATTTVGGSAYSKLESKYTFPLYTLFHPMDGFGQLKPRKIGSLRVAGIILVALFAVFTLEFFATGYIFNQNRLSEYSLLIMLMKTIGIALLFVISNWAVCTLFNGNGNLKEITCVTTYALLPLIFAMFVNVVMSNFLSGTEGAIMSILLTVCIVWSFLLLLCGLYCIHEYNMTQTFFSVIATVLGMAVIVFLLIMFTSLLQQTWSFIYSIVLELIQR